MLIPLPLEAPLNIILIVLLDLFGLYLSFTVYWADRSNNVNKGFFLMVIFILCWVTFYLLAQYNDSALWFRLFTTSVFFFFIAYYFFIIRWFLQKEGRYKVLGLIVLAYGLFFGLLSSATSLVISGFEMIEVSFVKPIFHPIGWWLFYGYALALTVLINWVLVKEYFNYSSIRKTKILYFLIGFLVSAILNLIFNVALPVFFDNYRFYEIGNYSIILLLGFVAYAIVKQKLFGVKAALTSFLVAIISILLLADIVIFSSELWLQIVKAFALAIFIGIGFSLVKAVLQEEARKENYENLSKEFSKRNRELESAYKKLKELDQVKSEFISIASHQLRTPLSAMRGYASMMLEGVYGKMPRKVNTPLQNVYQANEDLVALVNNLLMVSRIETGRIQFTLGKTSIQEIAKKVKETFEKKEKEGSIVLKDISKEGVDIDIEKTTHALLLLLDYYIRDLKATEITISSFKKEKRTGISLQARKYTEKEEDVIDLLFTEEEQKILAKFSGLELYITKKFIELQGGTIYVEKKGRDIITHITFPTP